MKIIDRIINFIFPANCISCKKGNTIICIDCFNKIPKFIYLDDNIFSLYNYKNSVVNKLLWRLKYHHNIDPAKMFGKVLAEELQTRFSNENIILIPIPLNLHDKRMHNHAELIANEIVLFLPNSKILNNILIKNSKQKQAHTKGRDARIKNAENVFSISPNFKLNTGDYKYIIVDDISTTGATIKNARRLLALHLNVSENEIFAITIAH